MMSQEEWVRAADGGDVAAVRRLIAQVSDSDRSSAMYRAVERDDLAIVQELAKGGEDIDVYALTNAISSKAEKVARWILDEHPDFAKHEGLFAQACATASLELLEGLLANGASKNDRESGWSGLANAARAKRGDIVDWLVKKKVEVRGWLLGAAAAGDLAMAKRAVKAGDTFDVVDEKGTSALMLAAGENQLELVTWIIEQLGAKPVKPAPAAKKTKAKPAKKSKAPSGPLDLADSEGCTAIAHAAAHGHVDIVRLLADHGAALDAAMANAIQYSSDKPPAKLEIVKLLLERGANVDARQDGGNDTALIHAAESGWLEMVDLLLEHGANLHAANIISTTPLSAAANNERVDVVKRLLAAGARLTVDTDSFGADTPLSRAISRGNVEIVRIFLDRGALDVPTRKQPLVEAASEGNLEIVKLLVERGADVNWTDDSYDQDTPLRKAAGRGHREIVEYLLEHGAHEPGLREGYEVDEYTAMHRAGAGGHIEVVELLAARGLGDPATSGIATGVADASNDAQRMKRALELAPDANAPGQYGWMPLHRASDRGHVDNVRILLDHGADPNRPDKDGKLPHRIATSNKHREVAALLEERGARLELVELIDLAGRGTDAEILAMLARPVNVNVANDDKRRALHEASEHGRLAIVRALLDKGAEIDAIDDDGWTALMEAADMGHTAIVELLLDREAKPFATDRQGFTAFALAEEAGRTDVVALMRSRSADIDPAVALEKAIENEDTQAIARLAPLHGFDNPLPNYRVPIDHAALENKPASITALIAAGDDADRQLNEYGYTPLYHAAEQGHLDAVTALLAGGAKPRANGTTQRAVWKGATEVVAALLDAGFDANELQGETSMVQTALECGHADIVRMLLDRGAIVTGKTGASLLSYVADREEHAALVDELLAKGAPVDGTGYSIREKIEAWLAEGRTLTLLDAQAAFESFVMADDDKVTLIAFAIAQGANPSRGATADDEPPILRAAQYGYWKNVEYLIDAGADSNARSDYATLPRYVAREAKFDLLEKLAAKGAKLDGCIAELLSADKLPKKPAERMRIASLCIAHGDNLDTPDDKLTPLVRAVQAEDADLAKLLVELGASVNAPTSEKVTPLMAAAEKGASKLVAWLVEKGADIHAVSEDNETALHFATRAGAEDLVDFFIDRGAKIEGCLREAVRSEKMSLVERFLPQCDLEERATEHGWTPVMWAANGKSKKIFELLLARGASVELCGITAAWGGNKAHLQIALSRGAKVDAQDFAKRTALMMASDAPACVELLLKEGANVDLQDDSGYTALIWAANYSEAKTCKLLLAAGANRGLRDKDGKSAADHARYNDELIEILEV